MELSEKVARLQGPILILGGSGFIGANLLRTILRYRNDVFATAQSMPSWRLDGVPERNIVQTDLLVDSNLDSLLNDTKPRTVFNCVAYGAYSFETDRQLIYQTNFMLTSKLLDRLLTLGIFCYVHSGSSSEYGDNAESPDEMRLPSPNSDYAVSKVACANLIHYFGKKRKLPCVNLRLYSIYGPLEDSSRLIPTLAKCGVEGRYPDFVNPDISRDFVYIDDACEMYIDAAMNIREEIFGESFNVGSGHKTTIRDVAGFAKEIFNIDRAPDFGSMQDRHWDVANWFGNVEKTKRYFGWEAKTGFKEGLRLTAEWYRSLDDKERYNRSSKKFALDTKHSVSAIIACYKDGQAIPIMYERLKATFEKMKIDFEIIFVNDNSPDGSEETIRAISRKDRRVIGISHSRNFGSQAAFRSGMEISTKNACVLLDGDLQDPPELIEQFVQKWREGFDVVYGCRIKREASLFMQVATKAFYRVFDMFSFVKIPHDAGDFSLIDRKVVQWILKFPERDLFLRGVRAFVGFKQIGVDYARPKRMFGESTNSFMKNIGWAKKGILSFSNTPLNILSFSGVTLLFTTLFLATLQVISRLLFPEASPKGTTTVLLVIMFFGSINMLGISILGEYIAKIFEEVKQRPHFIRRGIIKDGEVKMASDMPTKK